MLLGISSFGTGPRTGPAATLALARDVEAHGFARFMLVERVLSNDAMAQCAAIAAATERIGLGTGIANVYLRHPEMLALAAAVAAEVSDGRFVLGLGPNNQAATERAGFAWRGAREALAETTATVRAVLDGSTGRAPACGWPVPVVWAAVAMETAELAGRLADGVMLYLATVPRIGAVLDRFDAAAAAAGRADLPLERSLLLPVFPADSLVSRVESMIGNAIHEDNPLYWGHLYGKDWVESRKFDEHTLHFDADLAADVTGSDPEVDIDFDLVVTGGCEADGTLTFEVVSDNVVVDANSSILGSLPQFFGCLYPTCADEIIEERVLEAFPHTGLSASVPDVQLCIDNPTLQWHVTDNGDFSLL